MGDVDGEAGGLLNRDKNDCFGDAGTLAGAGAGAGAAVAAAAGLLKRDRNDCFGDAGAGAGTSAPGGAAGSGFLDQKAPPLYAVCPADSRPILPKEAKTTLVSQDSAEAGLSGAEP